jgi:hypothetical protein
MRGMFNPSQGGTKGAEGATSKPPAKRRVSRKRKAKELVNEEEQTT